MSDTNDGAPVRSDELAALPASSPSWSREEYVGLVELAFFAMAEPDLDHVLNAIAERLRAALSCDYTKILDHRASGTGMLVRAGAGWPPGTVGHREVPDDGDDSQGAYTLRTMEPVVVVDVQTEGRFNPPALLLNQDVRSGISVVIPGDPDPYGVLEADSRTTGVFSVEDIPLMEAYASLLGRVIGQHEREEAIANFASIAAHEMRTPLTSVIGFSRRLLRRLDQDGVITPDHREELAFVHQGAVRLSRSIELFLALGEVERRELKLDLNELDLHELVEVAIAAAAPLYPETRFSTSIDEGDVSLVSDPLALERVLGNLIENGAKYSPAGAEVHVSASRRDDSITIEVADECGGVRDVDSRHLFQRAYRGNGESRGPGLGIGLYVSLRLTEHLNGTLALENRLPTGCVFQLTLPVDANNAEPD